MKIFELLWVLGNNKKKKTKKKRLLNGKINNKIEVKTNEYESNWKEKSINQHTYKRINKIFLSKI